jgi:hypothetical protein
VQRAAPTDARFVVVEGRIDWLSVCESKAIGCATTCGSSTTRSPANDRVLNPRVAKHLASPSQDTDAVAPQALSPRCAPRPARPKKHTMGARRRWLGCWARQRCATWVASTGTRAAVSSWCCGRERARRRPRACAWSGPARGRSGFLGGGKLRCLAYSNIPSQTDMQAYMTSIRSIDTSA